MPLCRALAGHQALYFGHVGDGNHVSVDGKTVNGECEQVEELYRIVGEMQGSVSAEHGIGLHKSPI
jgi:FAD/FMN-containing dehydrogenase